MKIDVKNFVEKRNEKLKEKIKQLPEKPYIVTYLLGDRKDSQTYVKNKKKLIKKLGMASEIEDLPDGMSVELLANSIKRYAVNPKVHGILIQLPLNRKYYSKEDEEYLINLIPPEKDVDGLTAANQAKLFMGKDKNTFLTPCTPTGIVELLKAEFVYDEANDEFTNKPLQGRDFLVIGRSQLLGNSLAQMLMREDANVTLLHSKSGYKDLGNYLYENNTIGTICLCAGVPDLLKGEDCITNNLHTIIDAGINVGEDGKLRGDFCKEDYDILDEQCIAYTTVPGGVGPITTHMLAYNLYKAYCLQNNIEL